MLEAMIIFGINPPWNECLPRWWNIVTKFVVQKLIGTNRSSNQSVRLMASTKSKRRFVTAIRSLMYWLTDVLAATAGANRAFTFVVINTRFFTCSIIRHFRIAGSGQQKVTTCPLHSPVSTVGKTRSYYGNVSIKK